MHDRCRRNRGRARRSVSRLSRTDRQGIEIDYCPKCRGVWLDRGELDKLIERTAASLPAEPSPRRDDDRRRYEDRDEYKRPARAAIVNLIGRRH